MNPLFGPNEAMTKALETYAKTGDVRPAGRAEHGRRRHPRPVHDRSLRPVDGLGRHRHADARAPTPRTRPARRSRRAGRKSSTASTGKLVPCDATTCPNAVDGVNYAPFASFGGWSGALNAASPKANQDAAYDFLSYMSSPAISGVDVTLGKTGYNPYRTSHFSNLQPWIDAGLSRGRREELSWRHQGQPREHEHGARPPYPADQALRAGRARHGRLAVPRGRARRRRHRAGHRRWLERHHRRGRQGPAARCVHRQPWRRSASASNRISRRASTTLGALRSDGAARWLFIWPTVIVILCLSLFPLIASVALSMSRLQFSKGGGRPQVHRVRELPAAAVRPRAQPLPGRAQAAQRPRLAGRRHRRSCWSPSRGPGRSAAAGTGRSGSSCACSPASCWSASSTSWCRRCSATAAARAH